MVETSYQGTHNTFHVNSPSNDSGLMVVKPMYDGMNFQGQGDNSDATQMFLCMSGQDHM